MTPRQIALDEIDRIAFWHGVGVRDVLEHDRREAPTAARRDAARYFRDRNYSFTAIGRLMKRDHTTILNLVYGKGWKCRPEPNRMPKNAGYTAGLI